jgi:Holliday junction resolvase RusA-like endonuclease
MKDLLLQPPIRIHYQLFFSDNKRRDKGNVLSILQKFFLDAAVKHGMLPDDNDNFIEMEIQYQPKKADESYCLVIIEEILDKSKKEDII